MILKLPPFLCHTVSETSLESDLIQLEGFFLSVSAVSVHPLRPPSLLLSDSLLTALHHSSSLGSIRDAISGHSSLYSDKILTPVMAMPHTLSLTTLDRRQLTMDIVSPPLDLPLFGEPLYLCAPFELMDNGRLTTSIQSTPGVASYCTTVPQEPDRQNLSAKPLRTQTLVSKSHL